MILSFTFASAEESYVILDLTKPNDRVTGENTNLDSFTFDEGEEAYAGNLYNASRAGRFGGISIKIHDTEMKISSTKNRFLKIMIRVDETGSQNAFDKLVAYYWYAGDPDTPLDAKQASNIPVNGLTSLHGKTEYITFVWDLGWGEDEKTIDRFRLDMFSSSIDKAATSEEGYKCGKLYIKYIGFFDTKEQADNYDPFAPEPTTEPTEEPTPEPTTEPATPPETEPIPETGIPALVLAHVVSASMTGILVKRKRKAI